MKPLDKKEPDSRRRNFLKTWLALGATVAVGGGAGLVSVLGQDKGDPSDEKETIKLLSPEGKLVEVPKSEIDHSAHSHHAQMVSNEEARRGMAGRSFVMVIDLAKCKNAGKCRSACNKMHHLPEEQSWVKIYKMQDSEKAAPYWQPTMCMHCDEPPCVKVCPVDATFKRQDGIVLVDNKRCIGCRFCMAACPYSTRVFNWDEPELDASDFETPYSPETSLPHQCGTVGKCDFCPEMVRQGMLPDCVRACPNGVFYFGDLNEDTVTNGNETVRFSTLIREKAGYRLMEDLGTAPRLYYLPPRDRAFPFEETEEEG